MRVLFVQTPSVEGASSERVYPIGIVTLAGAILDKGHEASLLDMNLEPDGFSALKAALLDYSPDVVAFSLRNIDPLANKNTSLVIPFIAAVKMANSLAPKAKLVAGGTGFSLFAKRLMLELPELDYGIRGEAEEGFPALLDSIDSPANIAGLCYRKNGGVLLEPVSDGRDMNIYTPPQRDLLDPARYLSINSFVPAMGLETKRGCPLACSYCVYPELQGRTQRMRNPSDVVSEMEVLHKEYGVERFHFTDPVINLPAEHLDGICNELLKRKLKIKWDGFMREDRLTKKSVALYERAGCECFSFSPDGLSEHAMRVLKKGLSIEQVIRAAEMVSETGTLGVYHFMVHVPGENSDTVNESTATLERLYNIHARSKNLGTLVLNNIRILPGTDIEAEALKDGTITNETDLLYPVYYNPAPYDALRYKLETIHTVKNLFMWHEVDQ
ncbi:MAG TPA: B12 lower ligand biosynthesis radical SAM protein BzaD [Nitrospirae bacterium]|nr:B12 lower ligand biosynthesis radical SAM protein BzaD [Nitrospirota bacterium]